MSSCRVGQNMYILTRCIYRALGRKAAEYMIIHGVYLYIYIRFWPTLSSCNMYVKGQCRGNSCMMVCRVGQNHIYTVYIRRFWQGNHQIYGRTRRVYTVLANSNGLRCVDRCYYEQLHDVC